MLPIFVHQCPYPAGQSIMITTICTRTKSKIMLFISRPLMLSYTACTGLISYIIMIFLVLKIKKIIINTS